MMGMRACTKVVTKGAIEDHYINPMFQTNGLDLILDL